MPCAGAAAVEAAAAAAATFEAKVALGLRAYRVYGLGFRVWGLGLRP